MRSVNAVVRRIKSIEKRLKPRRAEGRPHPIWLDLTGDAETDAQIEAEARERAEAKGWTEECKQPYAVCVVPPA